MYNKYIIPICEIQKSKVYNICLDGVSLSHCEDKIMELFRDYSECDEYADFVKDLDKNRDILIGEIKEIDEF